MGKQASQPLKEQPKIHISAVFQGILALNSVEQYINTKQVLLCGQLLSVLPLTYLALSISLLSRWFYMV